MKAVLRISAATAGAALVLGAGGAAYAASSASSTSTPAANSAGAGRLDAVKAIANARIQGRLATLHALSLAVSDSKYLTSAEKSALDKQIDSDVAGLTALSTKMAAETTAAAVRADEVAMVDDYRVYVLMAPQTRLTEALAAESDAAATLQKAYTALSDLAAKEPGGATAAQRAQLADLQAQVNAAEAAIANQMSTELAIQPGPNETAIQDALKPVKDAVRTAHQDLVKARADAKALRASLKA
jgi:hypothetical protein